jgi:hypothetical protein
MLSGTVREVTWHGERHSLTLEVAGGLLRLNALPMRDPPVSGTRLTACFHTDDATLIVDDE